MSVTQTNKIFRLIDRVETYGNHQITTIVCDGKVYFKGKDVAEILGYAYPKDAIRDNVDLEDRKALSALVRVES